MSQKGQTTLEYLLVLVVSVGLGFTFLKKMSDYFTNNPKSFINRSLSNYTDLFGRDPKYKKFRVLKH